MPEWQRHEPRDGSARLVTHTPALLQTAPFEAGQSTTAKGQSWEQHGLVGSRASHRSPTSQMSLPHTPTAVEAARELTVMPLLEPTRLLDAAAGSTRLVVVES